MLFFYLDQYQELEAISFVIISKNQFRFISSLIFFQFSMIFILSFWVGLKKKNVELEEQKDCLFHFPEHYWIFWYLSKDYLIQCPFILFSSFSILLSIIIDSFSILTLSMKMNEVLSLALTLASLETNLQNQLEHHWWSF